MLENFFNLEISETLIESYRKVFTDLVISKEKDTIEQVDDDEEEPPTTYGDQSYDQRTCIYVLNRETLEREYNMTQMNFFNSNFFNAKPSEINQMNKNEKTELKKKEENDVFATEEQGNQNHIQNGLPINGSVQNNLNQQNPQNLQNQNNPLIQQNQQNQQNQ